VSETTGLTGFGWGGSVPSGTKSMRRLPLPQGAKFISQAELSTSEANKQKAHMPRSWRLLATRSLLIFGRQNRAIPAAIKQEPAPAQVEQFDRQFLECIERRYGRLPCLDLEAHPTLTSRRNQRRTALFSFCRASSRNPTLICANKPGGIKP
jgi:hypothetical protein